MKNRGSFDYSKLKTKIRGEMFHHFQYIWGNLSSVEQSALKYSTGKSSIKPALSTLNRLTIRGIQKNDQPFCEPFTEFINEFA